jgi:hypothetical protein
MATVLVVLFLLKALTVSYSAEIANLSGEWTVSEATGSI